MEIKGKIHCFFEQSGIFKNEFRKLGYEAEDYDIQNNFGETDHQIDLFKEIEQAYSGSASIFDHITTDDLIMAFFPCIYFTDQNSMCFTWGTKNYKHLTYEQRTEKIIERAKARNEFYILAIKMLTVAQIRNIRLIMENPYSGKRSYLKGNFVVEPALFDMNRQKRGDYYVKPTAYWYINCKPTVGYSYQTPKETKTVLSSKPSAQKGVCSEERSLISPDYARNFICDFILGKPQAYTQQTLF